MLLEKRAMVGLLNGDELIGAFISGVWSREETTMGSAVYPAPLPPQISFNAAALVSADDSSAGMVWGQKVDVEWQVRVHRAPA